MGTDSLGFITHKCCPTRTQRHADRLVEPALASCITLTAVLLQPGGSVRTSARFIATH